MSITGAPPLIEILKKSRSIDEAGLKRALELQKSSGKKLIHILSEEGIISERDLALALSTVLGIPALNLHTYKIDPKVAQSVPRKIAERYELIPLATIGSTITIAISDPLDIYAIDDVKQITHCSVQPVIATPKDIEQAIELCYAKAVDFEDMLEDIDPDSVEVVDAQTAHTGEETVSGDDAPVIRMVNLILQEAIKNRASDIHFEPFEDRLRIRYRIDGVLRDAFSPPRDMYGAVLTRLKIVSDLNITEKRVPQDGRFKVRLESKEIDFRISILPTYHGEKVVLRILDRAGLKPELEQLGFTKESVERLQKALTKPYGIALVTGPTGSGKSTTLYTILSRLNTKDRNVMTIEDPVEYQLEGISQTQANPEIGLTFSSGLRALLRQNPDIILVGEIRDGETADIAIKSALTGHLVFSTLHTNNAAGAVTRLVDMGVEPFLISSSLIVATAQRLMRRICPRCRKPHKIPEGVLARLPGKADWIREVKAYQGQGCAYCRNTGYRGRMSVMEVLTVDEEIQELILENRPSLVIEEAARKKGMRTLFEEALFAFQQGLTTLEEVLRVTTFDE